MKAICLTILIGTLLAGCSRWDVEPKQSITTYSKGSAYIPGTFSCNLDLGQQVTYANTGSDFLWDQITSSERYITPRNGARYSLTNATALADLSYNDLMRMSYSNSRINGSAGLKNQIPTGKVVAYVTNEGRYGAFRITNNDYNLSLSYITYDKPK